ncbi:pirin family protein [Nocardioides sp. zg-579]|uniref:Pirin family protein n=1 Tax=Nocardioides marmotae TaxID=2663857 RepID=A0A6I3JE64_9ACTN|nr:pirin family protein [Gordonia jinghuaiqii]MTB96369.1 pirin family protein [Nocardioides marmotae]
MDVTTEIRRGSARFLTRSPGMVTHHGFSFGEHYDPERLRFGPMVCHDDHHLGAGRGFETHRHSGLDIVTWVVEGRLAHRDSHGHDAVLSPGEVAVLAAGSGVEHAEHATPDGRARFVQVWLAADPERADAEPSYAVTPAPAAAPGTGLVELVSPQPGAVLSVARLGALETLTLPAAPLLHAYVVSGALTRSSLAEPLAAGDAFLFTDEPAHEVTAAVPTELLVWTFGG